MSIPIDDDVTELIGYVCADCGGNDWTLRIGQRSDGKTFLVVSCGNSKCLEHKRKELGTSPDALLIWDEFDISDSSYGQRAAFGLDPGSGRGNDEAN